MTNQSYVVVTDNLNCVLPTKHN